MADRNDPSLAEKLYAEGMAYDWRGEQSPASTAIARAAFEQAASVGHVKALRELSEMMFQGSGGPQERERALWLKWAAFVRGDQEALEELSDMLGSFAEAASDDEGRKRAERASEKAEEAHQHLRWLGSYLHELVRTNPSDKSG